MVFWYDLAQQGFSVGGKLIGTSVYEIQSFSVQCWNGMYHPAIAMMVMIALFAFIVIIVTIILDQIAHVYFQQRLILPFARKGKLL